MSTTPDTTDPAVEQPAVLEGDGVPLPCPRCGTQRVRIVVADLVDGTCEQSCLACHVVMMAQVASAIGAQE